MADVLARIVARKRVEVAERLGGNAVDAPPTSRSLARALGRPGSRFILEVKRRSPSGHRSVHSLDDAVRAYASVADAISVLTDGPDFGGSLDDLRKARKAFDGPILAKDFIVDPAQVSEARAAGADAVLAMLSVLANREAAAVLAEARRLGMDAIVEVHDEAELERALALGARVIGINNRDLKSLDTNLSVTRRLAPLVPADRLVIAESGIGSHADVQQLAELVDAFLVGSSLMGAPEISETARALVHGRIKVCGLTRAEDAVAAASAGATHAGLVLVAETPRAVAPDHAGELALAVRDAGLKCVGVFRDTPAEKVARVTSQLGLSAVQLHGSEDPTAYRSRLDPSVEVWAACRVGKRAEPARVGACRSLFDSGQGGTGRTFDWTLVKGRADLARGFLAGGIGPHNARRAAAVGAFGLDVGSSLESAPGIKDPARIAALFDGLRPLSRGELR